MAAPRRVRVLAGDWAWVGDVIATRGAFLWVQPERGGAPVTVHQNEAEDPDVKDPRQGELL
jgi:hypothetical protein